VATLAAGGGDDGGLILRDSGQTSHLVEAEVKALLEAALVCAKDVINSNRNVHDGLSRRLESDERLNLPDLVPWFEQVSVPASLKQFVLKGELPRKR
jgi:ATP-dependent Zn protease